MRFDRILGAVPPKSACIAAGPATGPQDDASGTIDGFTTLDANIRWSFAEQFRSGSDTSVTLGVANLFDEDPPLVDIAGSYDPRSADPRGRRVFVSVGLEI